MTKGECFCLGGSNPYRDQVQGRALESQPVVGLLRRAADLVLPMKLEVTAREVVDRLAANRPRLAVISGSLDHTAHLRDYETVLLLAAEIWRRGGVPFTFGLPTVCDGTAQSTIGMCYSLFSRNVASEAVVTQMEAHSYHSAVIVQGCDKTPMAILNGLLMLDRLRRERGEPPVHALFAPVHVLRGGRLAADTRERLLDVARQAEARRRPEIAGEIRETLDSVLLCTTNQAYQGILERASAARLLPRREKATLENDIAAATGHEDGGMCSFNGTGNSTRFVMAALGLVHPAVELLCQPANQQQIAEMMGDFFTVIERPAHSVSHLVEKNLKNAVRAHSALGGSTNLVLHIVAAMNYAGYDFSIDDLFAIKDAAPIPDVFRYSLAENRDVFRFAKEHKKGGHRGTESVYRVLRDLGVPVDLDAPTVTGTTWRRRLRGAPKPSSAVLSSAPLRPASGIDRFRGNFFSSAVVKSSGMTPAQVEAFDKRVYAVVYFENEDDANSTLLDEKKVRRALASGLRVRHLQAAHRLNDGGELPVAKGREALVDAMTESGTLKIAFVIGGQGPCAFGIPEMFTPMQHINANSRLRRLSLLITDGRYSGVTQGPAFGHVTPEALTGGGILYLKTGDFIGVDFEKQRLDLLDPDALATGRRKRRAAGWTDERQRLGATRRRNMERRRLQIAPLARLEGVSSAEHGVVPEIVRRHATNKFA